MKIAIFGSTGGTGREVVKQALDQGHEVTAFARTPAKLDIAHENLRIVKGDVLERSTVETAVAGQDAVLVALGSPALKENGARSTGTRNIIDAMKRTGVRRLVCESAFGVGDSDNEHIGYLFRYFIRPLFLRKGYAEHESQEKYLRESGLDWVIVRPVNLTDGPRTGTYQHAISFKGRSYTLKISRADVADFMLGQLTRDSYLSKAAAISY